MSVSAERLAQIQKWNRENPEKKASYIRKWRARNLDKVAEYQRRYNQRNREKRSAQYAVYTAVKRGDLVRPDSCESCGAAGRIEAHHEDYTRKLDVRWLCPSCHAKTKPNTISKEKSS